MTNAALYRYFARRVHNRPLLSASLPQQESRGTQARPQHRRASALVAVPKGSLSTMHFRSRSFSLGRRVRRHARPIDRRPHSVVAAFLVAVLLTALFPAGARAASLYGGGTSGHGPRLTF